MCLHFSSPQRTTGFLVVDHCSTDDFVTTREVLGCVVGVQIGWWILGMSWNWVAPSMDKWHKLNKWTSLEGCQCHWGWSRRLWLHELTGDDASKLLDEISSKAGCGTRNTPKLIYYWFKVRPLCSPQLSEPLRSYIQLISTWSRHLQYSTIIPFSFMRLFMWSWLDATCCHHITAQNGPGGISQRHQSQVIKWCVFVWLTRMEVDIIWCLSPWRLLLIPSPSQLSPFFMSWWRFGDMWDVLDKWSVEVTNHTNYWTLVTFLGISRLRHCNLPCPSRCDF